MSAEADIEGKQIQMFDKLKPFFFFKASKADRRGPVGDILARGVEGIQ